MVLAGGGGSRAGKMPVAVMAESSFSFKKLLEQCETQELEVRPQGGREERCWGGPGGAGGLAGARCVPARLRGSAPPRSAGDCGHKHCWRRGLGAAVTPVEVSAGFCLKVL